MKKKYKKGSHSDELEKYLSTNKEAYLAAQKIVKEYTEKNNYWWNHYDEWSPGYHISRMSDELTPSTQALFFKVANELNIVAESKKLESHPSLNMSLQFSHFQDLSKKKILSIYGVTKLNVKRLEAACNRAGVFLKD